MNQDNLNIIDTCDLLINNAIELIGLDCLKNKEKMSSMIFFDFFHQIIFFDDELDIEELYVMKKLLFIKNDLQDVLNNINLFKTNENIPLLIKIIIFELTAIKYDKKQELLNYILLKLKYISNEIVSKSNFSISIQFKYNKHYDLINAYIKNSLNDENYQDKNINEIKNRLLEYNELSDIFVCIQYMYNKGLDRSVIRNDNDELKSTRSININKNSVIEETGNSNTQNYDKYSIDEDELKKSIEELDNYIGLYKVKEEINTLVSFIKIRKIREKEGFKNPDITYHLCFLGNPGTGKTTVARILANIYKSLGVLSKGHLIEVGRNDLVGGYVGQTAIKTKEVIEKSYGGVLFIDEAYSLTNKGSENDFGSEAIEVVLKEMEDHRDDLVVIVAGYEDLMIDFIDSNPGLKSRFNTFIHFEDYDSRELLDIIKMLCKKNDYIIDGTVEKKISEILYKNLKNKDKNFANARYARNLFENAIKKQSIRLSKLKKINNKELKVLKKEDFD